MEGLSGFRGKMAIKELMLASFHFYIYHFKLEDLNEFCNRIKCDLELVCLGFETVIHVKDKWLFCFHE